jgi:hypothetical protein
MHEKWCVCEETKLVLKRRQQHGQRPSALSSTTMCVSSFWASELALTLATAGPM